jgi:hypothetical protein
MSTLENAIRIAVMAHAGQTDKGGAAYITHPLRLLAAVEPEEAKMVAVLHDVVEDTTVTVEDLRREGFGEGVVAGVACVTHRRGEPYADYVIRCKSQLSESDYRSLMRAYGDLEGERRVEIGGAGRQGRAHPSAAANPAGPGMRDYFFALALAGVPRPTQESSLVLFTRLFQHCPVAVSSTTMS